MIFEIKILFWWSHGFTFHKCDYMMIFSWKRATPPWVTTSCRVRPFHLQILHRRRMRHLLRLAFTVPPHRAYSPRQNPPSGWRRRAVSFAPNGFVEKALGISTWSPTSVRSPTRSWAAPIAGWWPIVVRYYSIFGQRGRHVCFERTTGMHELSTHFGSLISAWKLKF